MSNPNPEPGSRSIHINPNFNQAQVNVHINPRFQSTPQVTPSPHINPNFVSRPLPNIPGSSSKMEKKQVYVNPSFLDPSKTQAYDETIKKAMQGKKIFLNPESFHRSTMQTPKSTPAGQSSGSSSEKENRRSRQLTQSTSKKSWVDTPRPTFSSTKKSLFKKIGTRKLIRMKGSKNTPSPSGSINIVKINSPVHSKPESNVSKFRKIGTKKMVRVQSIRTASITPQQQQRLSSPRYKVNTKHKVIIKPAKSIFSTPFSMKKKQGVKLNDSLHKLDRRHKLFGNRFSNIFSPFKVERRTKPVTPVGTITIKPQAPVQQSKTLPEPKPKRPVPPKPTRKKASTTLINVQGVRYAVTDNGHKLNRLEPPKNIEAPKVLEQPIEANSAPLTANTSKSEEQKSYNISEIIPRKLYLGGEEYIEEEPGVLIRSRNSMTRQSITSYKNRSINTIIKCQTRSKQYCMFYNKFGKCNKKEKGMCPYIHDPTKVAVCRKFLQANCHIENCLLSHQVEPDKMPSCKFFLQGLCTKDNCPYRHVNVNPEAEVCPEFLKGYCPDGEECKKKHVYEGKNTPMRERKVPPAKPKRKSICQTPAQEKKARVRYYDDKNEEEPQENAAATDLKESSNDPQVSMKDFEEKRKRLLRKVELAKQGWTGVASLDLEKPIYSKNTSTQNLDDSGPYEEIPEETVERPPLGKLPSYISLETTSNVSTDCKAEDRTQDNLEQLDERLI